MAQHAKAARLHSGEKFGMFFNSKAVSSQIELFANGIKEQALRPAAFAACTVLYDEIRVRAPEKTGGLRDAVYRYRDITRTRIGLETWTVGINQVKAPHYHLIEFGHVQPYVTFKAADGKIYTNKKRRLKVPKFVPAVPFFRPSYDAKIHTALQVGLDTLKIKIKDLV